MIRGRMRALLAGVASAAAAVGLVTTGTGVASGTVARSTGTPLASGIRHPRRGRGPRHQRHLTAFQAPVRGRRHRRLRRRGRERHVPADRLAHHRADGRRLGAAGQAARRPVVPASAGTGWTRRATYTTGPVFVRLSFPVTGGLRPTLTEFAPDGQPTVLFGLTLIPVNGQATTVSVAADAHSQVAAAYPVGFDQALRSTPSTTRTRSRPAAASSSSASSTRPWYAEVGAATHAGQPCTPAPASGGRPRPASRPRSAPRAGAAQLTWNLPVPAAGRTLWLGVAGSHTGAAPASAR